MPPSLDREAAPTGPIVSGFAENGFRVNSEVHSEGLWLTPEWARGWATPPLVVLSADMLAPALDIEPAPEFLLLGTGPALVRPPRAFIDAIESRGIGVEAMDSRAAARAWGVLRGEGRWIVAALLPLSAPPRSALGASGAAR